MNKRSHIILLWLSLTTVFLSSAQSLKFAFVSDTHIGNHTAAEDLRRTVQDINNNPDLRFIVLTGDITEFGSDEELKLAKQILDSLNKPWYIVAGNHDSNWSESGSNSFLKVFGAETFSFTAGGYLFAATSSGPNMRMGPGQVPRENIVWLDSVLNEKEGSAIPVIYLNHYPQDSSQNNWYEAIDRLKKKNVQLILCGHGHSNRKLDFEGIPAVMGRSNLRAKDSVGGYNIVTIAEGMATFEVRRPLSEIQRKWLEVPLANHHFKNNTNHYFRPSYSVNKKYSKVRSVWQYQNESDVGSGTAIRKDLVFAANTQGQIYALNRQTGELSWSFQAQGKIYSTPEVLGNYVVAGSSDNHIYCLSASNGQLVWKYATAKAVLGSPVIKGKRVFIGGSDGHFRSFDLKTGKLIWDFGGVKGFIVTKPLIYKGTVFFGCWANDFYALNMITGQLLWKWNNGTSNRMFSPAACYPVATNGRVFIVAPDRFMTALNAETGEVIWRKQMPGTRVRESMGLSRDKSLVYVKTMDGQLKGISTTADSMEIKWISKLQLPYELTPSAILESGGVVYVPSHSGLVSAIDRKSGEVLWQHKISNSLINPISAAGKNKIIVSSMDGRIAYLHYSPK